ncbi:MAG: pilus assembly protein [Lachnospiraceae bacterium]|nr:pilus assembly protein [Lachnospiraceae bacterium]
MKFKEELERGSFTVEAVFVVPIVLFALFFLLSVQFYLHQRTWFTAAAYEAAMSSEQETEKAQRLLQENPITLGKAEYSADIGKKKIVITYRGQAFSAWILKAWDYEIQGRIERQQPVTHIRRLHVLKTAGSQG